MDVTNNSGIEVINFETIVPLDVACLASLICSLLSNGWCEEYEIIHFWTAVVDENEEWSSQ